MNILHLIDSLDIGGAQIRLINDLRFINKTKFNNVVCSLNGKGKLSDEITSLGIKSLFKLVKIIRQNRVDVIHTQLFFSDIYGRLFGKILKVPFIVTTVQSSVYEPDAGYLYSLKRKLVDRYSGIFCNRKFIAVSDFVKDSISKHLKIRKERIEVIPNYVDFVQVNKIDREKLTRLMDELCLEPKEIALITVGRLNPAKGIEYLLKAFSDLCKKYDNLRLIIVGDGFLKENLERQSSMYKISNKVMFLGERDDVKELICLSDIFIFPSLSEGMPVSLLEAMAIEKPCIASDIGPHREIINNNENGMLVRVKNAEDIVEAVKILIEKPKKARELAQNGRDFVEREFNIQNVKQLERLYESLS